MGNNSQIITGGGDITVTTGTATPTLATINIASRDLLYAGSPDTSINSGKISLTATGDINAAGVTLRANAGYGDANAGDIILVSQAGSINVGTLDTAVFFNGNGGEISLSAQNDITTGELGSYGDVAGSITLTAGGDITVGGDVDSVGRNGNGSNLTLNAGSGNIILSGSTINTSGGTNAGGNISLTGNVRLISSALTINTTGGTSSGNITFNNQLDGTSAGVQNLTLNPGTGTITFNGIGNSVPLGNLTLDGTGRLQLAGNYTFPDSYSFNNRINLIGNTTINSGNTLAFNNTLAAGANNLVLSANTINFASTVSSTGNLTLNAANSVTQTGAISANGLELLGNGSYTLTNPANDISTLAGNTTGAMSFQDSNGFNIGSVNTTAGITTSSNLTLNAGGAVTQTEKIFTNGLELLGNGSYTLTNPANDISTLAGNTTGAMSFQDSNGFNIGSVNTTAGITTSSNLTLNAGGAVTQTEKISTNGLELLGNGSYTLTNPANDISTLAGNTTGAMSFQDSNGFNIGSVNTTAGITTSSNLTLNAGGAVTQTEKISTNGLELLGNGSYTLTNPANDISTLAGNTTGSINYTNSNSLAVGTVSTTTGITTNGGNIALTSLFGDINASAGTLNSSSSSGNGGATILTAPGDINTSQINTQGNIEGGAVSLTSNNGAINTTETISTLGNIKGGDVTFTALGNISTDNIATASIDGNGGKIILESTQGAINTTNNCNSSCAFTSSTGNGTGGDITLKAASSTTTGSLYQTLNLAVVERLTSTLALIIQVELY
jgi:hypothetical protein